MRLLLDTHIFLWFVSGDDRMPKNFIDEIRNADNEVFLSVASIWEIVVKHELGRLPLPASPLKYISRQRELHQIKSLPITEASLEYLVGLPHHHRDPFDRILISQSVSQGFTFVTVDSEIERYEVTKLEIDS